MFYAIELTPEREETEYDQYYEQKGILHCFHGKHERNRWIKEGDGREWVSGLGPRARHWRQDLGTYRWRGGEYVLHDIDGSVIKYTRGRKETIKPPQWGPNR